MQLKVLINGALGKMGQEAVKAVQADEELVLVGAGNRATDLKVLLQTTQPDVVVDLTTPQVVYDNVTQIIHAGARPVIGTTGLTPTQITTLTKLCAAQQLGGLIVPNFSLGAVLMMQFAKMAAHYFPDVAILELHHPAKLDAPSGTALLTAAMIAAARTQTPQRVASQETIAGALGAHHHEIPIHSIRLPGLIASQELLFGGQSETLSIRHDASHREAFMPGLRLACKKVMTLNGLVIGLDKVLFST